MAEGESNGRQWVLTVGALVLGSAATWFVADLLRSGKDAQFGAVRNEGRFEKIELLVSQNEAGFRECRDSIQKLQDTAADRWRTHTSGHAPPATATAADDRRIMEALEKLARDMERHHKGNG